MGGFWITSFAGMAVLPGLIGVFVGAPLVAHDFETGAYRFGLAQDVSWRRQLVAKVLVIGAIVLIGSCLLGLLEVRPAVWPGRPGRIAEDINYPAG